MGLTPARVLGLKPVLCRSTPFVHLSSQWIPGHRAGITQSVGPSPRAKENQHPNRLSPSHPTKMHHIEKASASAAGHSGSLFVLGKHMSGQAFFAFFLGLSHKTIVVMLQG